jgi:hypothetical protein
VVGNKTFVPERYSDRKLKGSKRLFLHVLATTNISVTAWNNISIDTAVASDIPAKITTMYYVFGLWK